jgi:hypothetical protein
VRTNEIMSDEHAFSAREHGPVPTRSRENGVSNVDMPVVCTLTPDAIAARRAGLLPGLMARADSREDKAEGVRLRFPPDALSAILEAVDSERQCCRFLRFDITVERDGGPIWLELTGPPGTRQFLSALLEM